MDKENNKTNKIEMIFFTLKGSPLKLNFVMDLLKTEKSLPVLALNFKKIGQNVQNKLPHLLHQISKNFNQNQLRLCKIMYMKDNLRNQDYQRFAVKNF